MDVEKLFKEEKRKYFDKLEDAYARGLMTTDEYELAKEKADIRILKEVSIRLLEMDNEPMGS